MSCPHTRASSLVETGWMPAGAGMTWETTLSLYAQKLIKNYERQARGRLQVGDALAEKENATVAEKKAKLIERAAVAIQRYVQFQV